MLEEKLTAYEKNSKNISSLFARRTGEQQASGAAPVAASRSSLDERDESDDEDTQVEDESNQQEASGDEDDDKSTCVSEQDSLASERRVGDKITASGPAEGGAGGGAVGQEVGEGNSADEEDQEDENQLLSSKYFRPASGAFDENLEDLMVRSAFCTNRNRILKILEHLSLICV